MQTVLQHLSDVVVKMQDSPLCRAAMVQHEGMRRNTVYILKCSVCKRDWGRQRETEFGREKVADNYCMFVGVFSHS